MHTQPKGIQTYDDAYYSANLIARKGINTTTREEYEPRTVYHRPAFDPVLLKGVRSAAVVSQLVVSSNRQSFTVDASEPSLMQASLFDYPGWTVLIDDREVQTSPASDSGEVTFTVPAGVHSVLMELRPTPIRRWSYYASLVTSALMILIIAFALVTTRNRAEAFNRARPAPAKTRSKKKSRR
jgi:hypothetical protein